MPWEEADVPHGEVHHHFYRSDIVGINSEYYVYTPPGFDAKSGKKYPVLYLPFCNSRLLRRLGRVAWFLVRVRRRDFTGAGVKG